MKPKLTPTGAYKLFFRHPLQGGKLVACGLGKNSAIAAEIVRGLEMLCERAAEFQSPWTEGRLDLEMARATAQRAGQLGFNARAVEIFCGVAPPDHVPEFTPLESLLDSICAQSPDVHRMIRIELPQLRAELDATRDQNIMFAAENDALRRKLNMHCNAKIADAETRWKEYYKQHHDEKTVKEATRSVRLFIEFYGGKMFLRDVRGAAVEAYLAQYKTKDGATPSSRTIRKELSYLSTFFSWCERAYDLSENPVRKVKGPRKQSRPRERITHFEGEGDLGAVLKALKDYPYWRAWVAVAALAGPRWSEQRLLRIGDYDPRTQRMRVVGKKTGGQTRHTPIEQTVLRPILEAWIKERERQRADENETAANRSDVLFPFMGEARPRKTDKLPHCWAKSGWSHFGQRWKKVRNAVRGDETYWKFGPFDWRHCAASAMGASGIDSGRISAWLGHSEIVARAHYVAPPGAALWGFRWEIR